MPEPCCIAALRNTQPRKFIVGPAVDGTVLRQTPKLSELQVHITSLTTRLDNTVHCTLHFHQLHTAAPPARRGQRSGQVGSGSVVSAGQPLPPFAVSGQARPILRQVRPAPSHRAPPGPRQPSGMAAKFRRPPPPPTLQLPSAVSCLGPEVQNNKPERACRGGRRWGGGGEVVCRISDNLSLTATLRRLRLISSSLSQRWKVSGGSSRWARCHTEATLRGHQGRVTSSICLAALAVTPSGAAAAAVMPGPACWRWPELWRDIF